MLRIFLVLFFFTAAVWAESPFPENTLILNEDNSHFFFRDSDQMTQEGLEAFIDQYANTAVTHIFLCPNASRANFENPARDAIWAPNSEGKESENIWPRNCKILHDKGLDPYAVWIARAREKKISPWISMRMNDLHAVDDTTNFMHSSFWVNHPQYWRVPFDESKNWLKRALNFRYPEVRKHAKDFIDVLFERYDFDGLELDWMRFGWHLTPGKEAEEGEFLTEVTAHARKRADEWSVRRGHPILISARVPANPDDAAALGMDGAAWGRAGLIDLLVPCPFWASTDFDIPVERWEVLLEGTGVTVIPGAEVLVRAWSGVNAMDGTEAQLRGFAVSEQFRGGRGIYLFNWMDRWGQPQAQEEYIKLLKAGFRPADLAKTDYDIPLTYRDTVPVGAGDGAQLPKTTEPEKELVFTVPFGPVPAGNGGVFFSLQENDGVDESEWTAALNGTPAQDVKEIEEPKVPYAKRTLLFSFPQSAFRPGTNEFRVKQTKGSPQRIIFLSGRVTQPDSEKDAGTL